MEETKVEDTQEVNQAGSDEIRDPKAVLEALERAKTDAKKYREQFEAIESTNKELTDKLAALEGDEGLGKYKRRLVELAAKRELDKKGVKDVDRIYGLMDAATLDLDAEFGLVGFDESLKSLQSKLPELFDTKRAVAGGADGHASGQPKRELSTTEAQVARLMHKN